MSSNTKHQPSSFQKLNLKGELSRCYHQNITTPLKIICRQKSKVSTKSKASKESNIQIIPSLFSRNTLKIRNKQALASQFSMQSLRSKGRSLISIPSLSKLSKKTLTEKFYSLNGQDYKGSEIKNLKSELKSVNSKFPRSSFNNEVCYQYGYSQLSQQKTNIKSFKNIQKNTKKFPEQSDIQRLLAKYNQQIQKNDKQGSSTEKTSNFRTLSTDDKSQKKIQLTKKLKNCPKKDYIPKKSISKASPSQKHKQKSKRKNIKTRKPKNSCVTLLPDYYDCLLINRVESKIQTLKQIKQNKEKNYDQQPKQTSIQANREQTHRKSQQNLLATKLKENGLEFKDLGEIFSKETKECRYLKQLNTHRIANSPSKKRFDNSAKIRTEKRSRN